MSDGENRLIRYIMDWDEGDSVLTIKEALLEYLMGCGEASVEPVPAPGSTRRHDEPTDTELLDWLNDVRADVKVDGFRWVICKDEEIWVGATFRDALWTAWEGMRE